MVLAFLNGVELLPFTLSESHGLRTVGLALGNGASAIEVAVTSIAQRPSVGALRAAFKERLRGRVNPLILVALYSDVAAICGPSGDIPPTYIDLSIERVERICRAALDEPDRHSALRFLQSVIPDVKDAAVSGLRNDGLFATHELEAGVPQRSDWNAATERARPAIAKRGQPLLEALGFTIESLPGSTSILRAAGTKTAIAVLLSRDEPPETASARFTGRSPISYALDKAVQENLPWVVVCAGSRVRLYPARTGVGTGQRGRSDTFLEINLDLIEDDRAGYLWLLLSADALKTEGSVEDILERSRDYAAELGKRLRDRIYDEVIPPLAMAVMEARKIKHPSAADLAETYQMTLTILFRLLFVAYAEDRDLLPYRSNGQYADRSLKHKARELAELFKRIGGIDKIESGEAFDQSATQWEEVERLWRAVDKGNKEWGVPPYNGGLFSGDPEVSSIGAKLENTKLGNRQLGPVLFKLLLDQTPEGWGPVDFRSLGVREFGTIYEGLLENELSIADSDLTVTSKGEYRPAGKKDEVTVNSGRVYLHNTSGLRKSTGSYFTKHFAVEHLLDYSLEPALKDHLARLDAINDERSAAAAFFDFRVADIAMGSGHFLVAAVDRIERALSPCLADPKFREVMNELARLRVSAREKLGPLAEGIEIEDAQLLRRQIARRCIYGVDVNPTAVELARLSIWIHTFVPGLPLSFLDHNLVNGNSLVGVATVDEARDYLREIAGSLFAFKAADLVGKASAALTRLGRVSDADKAEIDAARNAFAEARAAVAPAAALFDVIAAARIDADIRAAAAEQAQRLVHDLAHLPDSSLHKSARKALMAIPPFHFPVGFPEVFLRDRAGFDVIIGNPPWDKAKVEEHSFWGRYFPGYRSLSEKEKAQEQRRYKRERPDLVGMLRTETEAANLTRHFLVGGGFPGIGSGDPDLYKAFC